MRHAVYTLYTKFLQMQIQGQGLITDRYLDYFLKVVVTHLTTIGPVALPPPPVMLARVIVTEIVTAEDLWSVEVITAMEETLDWTAVNTGEDQDGVLQILLKTWKMMM